MVFHSVLLEVSIIWKYVIAEVTFVQHSAVWCALWLTGGRTEKDRNLAILDRASGIKSGKSWQRTGDKSRHNIGQGTFSFLCLRASALYFLIFSSLFRSFIHQNNKLSPKSSGEVSILSNKIFGRLSTFKGYFSRNRFSVWKPQYFTGEGEI